MTQVSAANSKSKVNLKSQESDPAGEKIWAGLALVTGVVMLVLASLLAYGYLGSFPKFYFTAAILTAGSIAPLTAGLYYLFFKTESKYNRPLA